MADTGPLYAELSARFGAAVRGGRLDPPFEIVELDRGALVDAATWLKSAKGFEMLMDLTAVDWRNYKSAPHPERFQLVYYVHALATKARLRLVVPVPDADATAPTLTGLWGSADWLEREVWDMFGIRFIGHPNLKRILMYEEFTGHPLRKDYPLMHQQPRVTQVFPGVPPFGAKPARLETEGS